MGSLPFGGWLRTLHGLHGFHGSMSAFWMLTRKALSSTGVRYVLFCCGFGTQVGEARF